MTTDNGSHAHGERSEDLPEDLLVPSLVPEDDTKSEVGPFTAFGQFGIDRLDTRVLWQDVVWVDRLGTPHFLTDMSAEYLDNVIGYLYTRAPEWHHQSLLASMADVSAALAAAPSGNTRSELEELAADLRALLALDPTRWVDHTPLMQRLRHLRPQWEWQGPTRDRPPR
jgi:hypothetical protein